MNETKDKFFIALEDYITEIDRQIMSGEKDGLSLSSFDNATESVNTLNRRTTRIIDNTENQFNEMLSSLKKAKFEQEVINYSRVTEIIFEKTEDELLDILELYLEESWGRYVQNNDDDIDNILEKRFLKIKEHIILSVKQKNQISSNLSQKYDHFFGKFSEVKKNLNILEGKITSANEKLVENEEAYEEKYNSITTQFITILGIFAAILMGAFGSLQGFSSMFSNAQSIPIGNILILSAIGGSLVILILFFLLSGVAKLTGRKLASCTCHIRKNKGFLSIAAGIKKALYGDSEDNERICKCSLFEKYPSIVVIHYLLYFIMLTGFALIFIDKNSKFELNFNPPFGYLTTVIILYLFGIISLIFIHKAFVTKRKGQDWYKQFKLIRKLSKTLKSIEFKKSKIIIIVTFLSITAIIMKYLF